MQLFVMACPGSLLSFPKASEKERNLCRDSPMYQKHDTLGARKRSNSNQLIRRAKKSSYRPQAKLKRSPCLKELYLGFSELTLE